MNNILNGNLKKIYIKYLIASIGSAMVLSIYSIVDMICVGQYHGEAGGAALGVILPFWAIIFSGGVLLGIGGATLLSHAKGSNNEKLANKIFSVSFVSVIILIILLWITLSLTSDYLIKFFGGRTPLVYQLSKKYVMWMKIFLPVYTLNQFFSHYVRNDNDPTLASIAVLAGGAFNIIGDLVFVFGFDMGISGAGLATSLGQVITVLVLLTHFIRKKNTIKFVNPFDSLNILPKIFKIGFSIFIVDIALGSLAILFNNQIVRLNPNEANATACLAVYGVISNVVALVQSFAQGIGTASQPLLSQNLGAGNFQRVKQLLKYGIISAVVLGVLLIILTESIPMPILKAFIKVKKGDLILTLAPKILRTYFLSFLILPMNVYSTYFLQAVLRPTSSFIVTILRGIIVSGLNLFLLPSLFGFDAIWFTMPITEIIILIIVIVLVILSIKNINKLNFKQENI